MSKVLVLWVIGYFGGLAMAVVHPMYALGSYLLFYYLPPHLQWWGRYLPDLRYSLLSAVVLGLSIFLFQGGLERLKKVKNPALPWLILFGLNALLVTLWAVDRTRSWLWTVALLKLIVLYILMPAAIRTPAHFDAFGAMHIAGSAYWGYKAWDDPNRGGGRLLQAGGADTQNDNQAAAHVLTVLPFGVLYALTARRKAFRVATIVASGFIVNFFILCNSRGATVGFVLAGLASLLLIGHGRRLRLAVIGVLGLVAGLYLADPTFIARQQTTIGAEDNSARARLEMWRAGVEMTRDYPLGAGARAFHALSPRYIPDIVADSASGERSGHNTYTQLTTSWGIQGTFLFGGFLVSTFMLLHRIRKKAADAPWFFNRALAIELGLIATLAAGMFSNRLYGESIYWLCALGFALYRMQATQTVEEKGAGQALPSPPVSVFAAVPSQVNSLRHQTRV